MWKSCWWATWVSGFFGIAGGLHLVRSVLGFRLVIGRWEIAPETSFGIGLALIGISGLFLWIEIIKHRAKKRREGSGGCSQ